MNSNYNGIKEKTQTKKIQEIKENIQLLEDTKEKTKHIERLQVVLNRCYKRLELAEKTVD